jgi:glycosyltransferase involved in cell wall biosynthesis
MDAAPQVSIVTSTYNRSAVLRRAIESVRAQRDFADWEMCIVGDCTPDDSEAVVASFGDPRLRFYNLPVKSPPRRARGDREEPRRVPDGAGAVHRLSGRRRRIPSRISCA